MKFLVIDRGGTIDLSPTEAQTLFDGTGAWVRRMMDAGKIEVAYALSGQMSTAMICNVGLHEELDDLLLEYPLSNYALFEIYPLSDALHSFAKASQTFAARRQMAA
ncbi:MAG TPA: muconolactone Delta-isomerase family protein [Candidatus Aquicultor sp.]